MRLVYDIETDGLDPDVIWCLVAHNLDTGMTYKYSDHDDKLGDIKDGVALLRNATALIGHNIINFDNWVIHKLYDVDLNKEVKVIDTWIMSQVLRYVRFKNNGRFHGLKYWGEHLGNQKIDFEDWSQYSREMLTYCVQDVMVNVDIYNELMKEFSAIKKSNPLISEGLRVEHDTAIFNSIVRNRGWNFNSKKAEQTAKDFRKRMREIEKNIEPQLGDTQVWIDKEPKFPKFKKNGEYQAVTARQLSEFYGKEVLVTDIHVHAAGEPYQRSEMRQIKLGQVDLVKDWLKTVGWQPDDWTVKKINGKWVKQSPKFTQTSLSKLGELGSELSEYYTLRNRLAVIEGWQESVTDGRLKGNMWTLGTPTFRARHENIVNLPGVHAPYGRELRELLEADDNRVIVGCDSSGNQLRGLCHYVKNDEFTKEVIYGDQHQRNADALGCSRPIAKNYLYAYLFGAGDAKLGQTLSGKSDIKLGKESREKFSASIQGLQELRDKVGGFWKQTFFRQGKGWFPALDGRPVFANSEHQCLNYLLQSAEAITCKAALSYAMRKIDEEGLDAEPRIWYHDEMAFDVSKEDADRVGEILKEAYAEAPKWFGVECMDGGDYVIGTSYADVH